MITDSKGNLYGTSEFGGAHGVGAVFELSPPSTVGGRWTDQIIYSFSGGTDGAKVDSGVIMDSQGSLYGAASGGGSSARCVGGCGTVFRLDPPSRLGGSWRFKLLHVFSGLTSDGYTPLGRLVRDSVGNIYGTTVYGGTFSSYYRSPGGVVFRLRPQGNTYQETVLHNFGGPGDGYEFLNGLTLDAAGNLYGVTILGGTGNYGTVFELSPGTALTWNESILYDFPASTSSGIFPDSELIVTSDGSLFGVAEEGGTFGAGAIFQLSPPESSGTTWRFQDLYSFDGISNGSFPLGLSRDPVSGSLYGTTSYTGNPVGGTGGCGVAYELSPPATPGGAWSFTNLATFGENNLACEPNSALARDSSGNLYGSTFYGAAVNVGFGSAFVIPKQ